MIGIQLILSALEGHILAQYICRDVLPGTCSGAAFFNPLLPFSPHMLYVAEAATWRAALPDGATLLPEATLFISAPDRDTEDLADSCGVGNLIVCDLPCFELHRRVTEAVGKYSRLVQAAEQLPQDDISGLLGLCGGAMDVSLLYTDEQLSPSAAALRARDSACPPLAYEKGALVSDLPRQLLGSLSGQGTASTPWNTSCLTIAALPSAGYLLCLSSQDEKMAEQETLLCARLLTRALKNSIHGQSSGQFAMQSLAKLLCGDRTLTEGSLAQCLAGVKRPVQKFRQLVLVRFDAPPAQQTRELFLELTHIFPNGNITWYDRQFIILLSEPRFSGTFSADRFPPLEQFLTQHSGYAMVSSVTRTASGLQQVCREVLHTIDLGRLVEKSTDDKRLMRFSDYAIYHVIDLAMSRFRQIYGDDQIGVLAHPYIIALQRYDHTKGTTLCDFLFYYLMHNHSIADTAAHFYMHRNTAVYQRDRIARIIHYQFDDPYVDFQLLFSLCLTKYYRHCLGQINWTIRYEKSDY